jgi:hypothetical protein
MAKLVSKFLQYYFGEHAKKSFSQSEAVASKKKHEHGTSNWLALHW